MKARPPAMRPRLALTGHALLTQRRNGKWEYDGELPRDELILAARKGVDMLNETPFDFDRPAGVWRSAAHGASCSQRTLAFELNGQMSAAARQCWPALRSLVKVCPRARGVCM